MASSEDPGDCPDLDKRFVDEYLSDMSRSEAMEALNAVQLDGAYIVRRGRESPYCISFLHAGCTKHVQIRSNSSGQFFLGDTKLETLFDTMSQLMEYLTKNIIQGVNGVVFRLLINAKTRSPRSQLPKPPYTTGSLQPQLPEPFATQPQKLPQPLQQQQQQQSTLRSLSTTGSFCTPNPIPNPHPRSNSISQPETAFVTAKMPIDLPLIRPLSQQRYFVDVRRDEAETYLLQRRTEGQFLVRPSKASAYCLSVFHRNRVVHLKIIRVDSFFVLEQMKNEGEKHSSVPDLIDSLIMNRRSLTMINGDCILLKAD